MHSSAIQASWKWPKLPKVFFFCFLRLYLFTQITMGWDGKALDPVNTASGARKGREKGGRRDAGYFFPCRISSGAGKAGALENTISLALETSQGFYHYMLFLKRAETSSLGSAVCGSPVGGDICGALCLGSLIGSPEEPSELFSVWQGFKIGRAW